MAEPKFKIGDSVYSIWRSNDPITIKWKGTKYVVFFPGQIVSSRILTDGMYDAKEKTYRYRSMGNMHQPADVFEDGLYESRYAAEKEARERIIEQVCGALGVFFECASKAGYGSKAAWREIMDAAIVKLYAEMENKGE